MKGDKSLNRLSIRSQDEAQKTIAGLYKDLERRIIASPPGQCPVDLAVSFLRLCHSQSCGKCVPCRVGIRQLQDMMENILDLDTQCDMYDLEILERTAKAIAISADCAIGSEAANMVLRGLQGYREDYEYHIKYNTCSPKIRESAQPVPCVRTCPANVDIPGYIALVKHQRYADAVSLIRKDNPFPTVCALICEHPCEMRCRRSLVDAPINIRGMKRYAVDNCGENVPVPPKMDDTGKRIAIIGGGPSGLTAAYYLAIMGPSGSGKTTLMNIIGCLDTPTSGQYLLDGEEVRGSGDNHLADIRNAKIGFVFQSFYLLPGLTVLDNVCLPLLYANVPKAERRERAAAALERIGLADRMDFYPNQISGGQSQRVAIARAMINDPLLLLADEPTGALDSASGKQVLSLFDGLNENGTTIVLITHDQSVASRARETKYILDGEFVEKGALEA